MGKSRLVKTVFMKCPICGLDHEVEERERVAKTIIKDCEIGYSERYYVCTNATDPDNSEFWMGPMINENLKRAKEAYTRRISQP